MSAGILIKTAQGLVPAATVPGLPGSQGQTGPTGLKGDKGDPGGFTMAASLTATQDLDALTAPGLYYRSGIADATVAAHEPYNGWSGLVEVTSYYSANYVQQRAWHPTPTIEGKARTYLRLRQSGTWGPWYASVEKGQVGSGDLTGTGMPNGVITAPVGTYYTDTAGTNGAWRWLKKSGTGNAGWGVVHGDTGWRSIGASLFAGTVPPIASGSILVRRINHEVLVQLASVTVSATTNATVAFGGAFPEGFRPSSHTQLSVNKNTSAAVLYRLWIATGTLAVMGRVAVSSSAIAGSAGWDTNDPITGTASYPTVEAWPTTLPGTAV